MARVIEEWRPVPGYEELYAVSNMGRVKSLFRYKRILHPTYTNGYLTVELWKDKKRKRVGVHRLVALAFVDNPENKPFVNHKDETRDNNNVNNLEWVTHVENCNYGTAIQRRVKNTDYSKRKIDYTNAKLANSKPIDQFTKDGKFIRRWASASECAKTFGYVTSCIRETARGKRKSAYGYIFKEVEICVHE